MTSAPAPAARRTGLRTRATEHLRSPLTRNGYALLLSSVITSVLGLAYWVIAARLYREGTLGRGAALVSAMLLVTSLATAGLKRALIRFVPTSGPAAVAVVRRIYVVGLGIALGAGIVFLTGFQGWSDGLAMLHEGWGAPAVFLVGIAGWGLFVLQDAVLIGAQRSTLVPITNTIFSVLKIAVLVAGWAFAARWGIFASWVGPALLVAVLVNAWLFRRGLRGLPTGEETETPTMGQVARFTSGEYVAALAWQAANYFTPLLVLARAGATANAHYYVPAQIAYTLFLVSSNVTDALVAEGARSRHGLAAKVRRTSLQTAMILVPGIALTAVAAPLVMSMFGAGYTGEAATVLRLLALAAAPNAVTTVVIAVAHVRQRMSIVVGIQTVMSALTLGLSWVLVGSHGVIGVAWAWLVAQLITAVVALGVAVRSEPALRRALLVRLVDAASAVRSAADRRRAQRRLRTLLPTLPADVLHAGPVDLIGFQHDLLVVRTGIGEDQVVVRLASGRQGRRGIAAHQSQLRSLHADPRLGSTRSLVPRVLRADPSGGWLVESLAEGVPASAMPTGSLRDRAVASGLTALDRLHTDSARTLRVGPELAQLWIHDPVSTVAAVVSDRDAARGLAVLHRRLEAELVGQHVTVARLHGDPSLDNLLFLADGSAVTGMVDWESSAIGLPECDLMVLLLARRMAGGGEMGEQIADLLANGWDADERALLGTSWSVNAHLRPTTTVLLTWLGHVAANLEKTDRYRSNRWWIRHNVEAVLAQLVHDPGARVAPTTPSPIDATDARPALRPGVAGGGADDLDGDAGPHPHRPRRPAGSTATLRVLVVGATLATWAAAAFDAPVALRIPLVLAATIALPAVVIGRCLGTPGPLVHGVIGTAGAVSAGLVLAEVLLYAGAWSPELWAVVLGLGTLLLSLRIPPFQPTRPTPPTPADAIVRRARSSKVVG